MKNLKVYLSKENNYINWKVTYFPEGKDIIEPYSQMEHNFNTPFEMWSKGKITRKLISMGGILTTEMRNDYRRGDQYIKIPDYKAQKIWEFIDGIMITCKLIGDK